MFHERISPIIALKITTPGLSGAGRTFGRGGYRNDAALTRYQLPEQRTVEYTVSLFALIVDSFVVNAGSQFGTSCQCISSNGRSPSKHG
jgi:hypothetical protein